MGKSALAAPVYVSVAWTLVISYRLFTEAAVRSVITSLNAFWPSISRLLIVRMDAVVLVNAFAWIFFLSSIMPSVILGRGRSTLIQFLVCLSLTLVALWIEDQLTLVVGGQLVNHIKGLSIWLQNPVLAALYLSAPYLFMIFLDILSRRKDRTQKELQNVEFILLAGKAPAKRENFCIC